MALEVKREKKEIEVTVKYLKCDLCNKRITPEELMITVKVSSPYKNMDISLCTKRDYGEIDVCSSDCLAKNIGGAQLIIDTRLIPEALQQIENPIEGDKQDILAIDKRYFSATTTNVPTATFNKVPDQTSTIHTRTQ